MTAVVTCRRGSRTRSWDSTSPYRRTCPPEDAVGRPDSSSPVDMVRNGGRGVRTDRPGARDLNRQHGAVELPRPDADPVEYPPSYTREKKGVNPIRQLNLHDSPPRPA